jgi:hypothetical protein
MRYRKRKGRSGDREMSVMVIRCDSCGGYSNVSFKDWKVVDYCKNCKQKIHETQETHNFCWKCFADWILKNKVKKEKR